MHAHWPTACPLLAVLLMPYALGCNIPEPNEKPDGGVQVAIVGNNQPTVVPFLFSASGSGSGAVGAFSIDQSSGTVEIGGAPFSLLPFQGNDFFATKQYGFAALRSDALYLVDFLCAEDDTIVEVWLSSPTDGTFQKLTATGACSGVWGDTTIDLATPAARLDVTPSARITMTATDGSLSVRKGAMGRIRLGRNDDTSTEYDLLPLAVRDCRTGCEEGSVPVTLSIFVIDRATQRVAPTRLGFYLDTKAANLAGARFLPSLAPFAADAFNGDWTID